MEMFASKHGPVSFVWLIMKYIWKRKKNHKVKLSIISYKLLHKFKTKKLWAKKKFLSFFVLISQDPCVLLNQFKVNFSSKVIRQEKC